MREKTWTNVALWAVQGTLAALFLFAGGMKLVLPIDQMAGPVSLPAWFLRFIGVAEVAGAIGLLLPAALRIQPALTPLAAAALTVLMVGATTLTVATMPVSMAVVPFVTGALAAWVAYARYRVAPIAPRTSASATPRVSAIARRRRVA
jgi:hypothetical protein